MAGSGESRGSDTELWLTVEQQEAWRAVISVMTMLPPALDSALRRSADLSMFEYTVLASLSEEPSRTLQMSALAVRANASLSRLSHVVARLEKRGWVAREVCARDGRATNAMLTNAGWEKIVAAAPHHVRSVRELVVDALSPPQFRQLGVVSARISRRVQDMESRDKR